MDSVRRNNYVRVVNGQINYVVPDTIKGCAPFAVAFTSPLPGCDTTLWSFGNGDSAFTPSVSYIYTTPGIYTVSFYGSMPGRCHQHINPFAIVQVFEFLPEPILTISASPCKPYQFQFNNLTPDIVSYLWHFGDGSPPDTSQSPTHVYAQAGTYVVSVTLTNIHGCVKTVTTTVTVGIPNPIQVLNNSGCVNTPVQFGINNPSQFSSLTWNFGDGSPPAHTANVSHTYTSQGSYLVTLIATTTAGCTDTFYTGPVAMHLVNASFTAQAPLTGCNTLTVQFTNTSTGATTYLWNFGDGNTSTQTNPAHTYLTPGSYTVTLTATNGNCSKTATQTNLIHVYQATADFHFVASGSCFPITVNYTDLSVNAVSWLWNFGDGNTSAQQHPTHVFTYQPSLPVSLTITDANGCTATRSKPNITGAVITASIADTLGCRPFTTAFQCHAPGALSWLWNFGDGNTSTQQNPVHTYTVAGVYTVTVTVTLNNCVSTITLPERVHVIRPQPNFTSPTVAVCAPSLVQFFDQSVGAVQWLWDFGDGTTSTLQHPAHIYSIPGSYTVSLRIWDSLGCTAMRTRPNYINVPGTHAYFTLTSTNNCLNTFVQFTDSSINASSWLWNFGDGHTSTLQHPSHNYQDTGSYIVSLITTDSLGCTSYYTYPHPIVVYPVPSAQGIITSSDEGCTPLTVSFQDQSYAFTSLTWLFGNGDSSHAVSPVYTYNSAGTFPVYLVAYNQFGCSDTAFIATVNALLTPTASFTASSTGICPSSQVTLISTSTGISNPSYQWSLGNLFSTQTSPSWTLTQPGFYTVTLTVTNDNGCSSSHTQTNFIEVFDTIPPPVTPLLSVSVLSNTSVEIKWKPSTIPDLYEYRLYRYNPGSGNYDLIYTLVDTSNANPVLNPEYIDTGLNTLNHVYTYKVQTVDRCLYRLPLTHSQAHTTINVTAQPSGTSIRVTWTPYGGCSVSYYEISRQDLNGGQWQPAGTVAGNSPLVFMDTTLYCPFPHSYRITAYDLCGNPYFSWSDTSVATPENILAGQKVEVIRSTVMFNKSILTEWSAPDIAPERVWQYDIYRSTDNLNFIYLTSVPAGTYSYLDHDVNINKSQYFYRVDVVNDCLLSGVRSNEGSSILLKSDWFNYQTHLKWTPYQKWDSDVDYYIIEKRNSDGQWVPIKIVEGNQTETTLDE
jgi:PKD repeat protein